MAFIEICYTTYYQSRVSHDVKVWNYCHTFSEHNCTKAIANELIYAVPPKDRVDVERIVIHENCKADVFLIFSDTVLVFDVNTDGVIFIGERKRGVNE